MRLAPAGASAAWMLAKREWVRFFRQRNRVFSALVQPLVFWLLFGNGLRGSFTATGGQDFLEFFLPGTIALIVLFTAIFSTISVIEDRREGFMQSVLVAPVGRWPILFGKVIGGSAIAWAQALVFLLDLDGRRCGARLARVTAAWTIFYLRLRCARWNDRGMANGQYARLSCDHDARLDADVVIKRIVFSDSSGGRQLNLGQRF